MADTLPDIFRKSSPYTVNYDWQDLTQGLGYRTYYGACTKLSGGKTYFLAQRGSVESQSRDNTEANGGLYTVNDGAGSELDLDFDIAFGFPAKVGGGKAYINLTIRISVDDHSTITGTVYHVDGTTSAETSLGTAATYNFTADNATTWIRVLLVMDLTEKQFKEGDKLRVSITSSSTDFDLYIFHDPSTALTFTDLSARTIGTDLVADIPFKVEM